MVWLQGEVRIFLTLQGTAEHTLDEVIACAGELKTNLRNYRSWSGGIDIGDENLILPDGDFGTESCAPVFFKPDVFEHYGEGWLCNEKKTVVSLGGADSIMISSKCIMIAFLTFLWLPNITNSWL